MPVLQKKNNLTFFQWLESKGVKPIDYHCISTDRQEKLKKQYEGKTGALDHAS